MMKKLLTAFACLSLVFLWSCSEEDEGGNGDDYLADLVGEWMITLQTNTGCDNSMYDGILDMDNSSSLHVTINANSTYSISQCGEIDETGDILEVTATTITLCETGDTDCEPEMYSLNGNTLTVTPSDPDDSGDLAGCNVTFTLEKNRDPADLLDPLVGTWTFTSMIISNCQDAGSEDCTMDCPTYTVDDDCSYMFDDGEGSPETGFVVIGDGWILTCADGEDCDFEEDTDSFSIDGNTLSVTSDDDNDWPGCEVTYVLEKAS